MINIQLTETQAALLSSLLESFIEENDESQAARYNVSELLDVVENARLQG